MDSSEGRSNQQQQIPLSPLMEGPDYGDTIYCNRPRPKETSWEVVRAWFRNTKIRPPPPSPGGGDDHRRDDPSITGKGNGRRRRLVMLGVLGCPLAPIPVDINCCSFRFHPHHHRIPERSCAQYIIRQYLAATGCLKMMSKATDGKHKQHQQTAYPKNMYSTGTLTMMCCETEMSSTTGSVKKKKKNDVINGCFVVWQMMPTMWSLELALSSGNKVLAGSDGNTIWTHIPSLGTHIARGPQRPLRRIIQGLDPKSTGDLFAKAEWLGESRIGEEECFVLKVCAGRDDVMARNINGHRRGHKCDVEVLRHIMYGYFSQKSGLLVYMEDSHLTRVRAKATSVSDYDCDCDCDRDLEENMEDEEAVYWETSIGSSIGDYREVEGLMIAHQGRSVATVLRFPAPVPVPADSDSKSIMCRTRFEECWSIDDISFDVRGLSSHSFLPPSLQHLY